mmetsp:Transcript_20775/g.45725  ORF Transcript_20775/g.45725 Transcript_20775/m.45725 type:complete len:231 (-) Transcript_20775:4299-4991(-)
MCRTLSPGMPRAPHAVGWLVALALTSRGLLGGRRFARLSATLRMRDDVPEALLLPTALAAGIPLVPVAPNAVDRLARAAFLEAAAIHLCQVRFAGFAAVCRGLDHFAAPAFRTSSASGGAFRPFRPCTQLAVHQGSRGAGRRFVMRLRVVAWPGLLQVTLAVRAVTVSRLRDFSRALFESRTGFRAATPRGPICEDAVDVVGLLHAACRRLLGIPPGWLATLVRGDEHFP